MLNLLYSRLADFTNQNQFKGQGKLSVALVVTDHAKKSGLPLNPDEMLTGRGGQVLGLSGRAVQTILTRHGIQRVLAREGGRTSRGSIGNMRVYVAFLNEMHHEGIADLDAIENFWIERVREFFAAKPFRIRLDASQSLRAIVHDIMQQAEERQREMVGVFYAGIVLQHFVGAKLDTVLGAGSIEHHSYSTSEAVRKYRLAQQ